MGQFEKLEERFLSEPKDFTWEELMKVLKYFGFTPLKAGKTGGSRRKFSDAAKHIVSLHKPHPSNIVKGYVIRQVIEQLKALGHLNDE
ncbi:type II toxin-antitoxin system HicA family toxin [Pedobacter frigidisoli]|uniref:type II toxin-antitoxin system HicA family toxin n=1 Tax=Pedobacter frigidisoli TaxID=2530455 RepID=UPI002931A88D|nr:type II toxin-antitoxin system HicA family toxin [Pedobacter frigidisoli]